MSFLDLISVLARRWLATTVCLGVTVVASLVVTTQSPVYWAQQEILFMLPQSDRNPNGYQGQTEALIATAGLIESDVSPGESSIQGVTDGVDLAGQGVRDGFSVRLPNSGGQWANNFDRAVLVLQVVGPDPGTTAAHLEVLRKKVTSALARRESISGVSAANRIRLTPNPTDPQVHAEPGRHFQALGASLLLGGGLSIAIVLTLERTLDARRRLPRSTN